jgi:hypothetical protein
MIKDRDRKDGRGESEGCYLKRVVDTSEIACGVKLSEERQQFGVL